MFSGFSNSLKKIWNNWNIRGFILFSLFLQIFLVVSAPSRKRTRGGFVAFVWLAYLLADWAASYCVGLISKNALGKSTTTENDYVMIFWGPFLLLHLGGPDTISAFAMEDNELWLRHLLSLVSQFATAFYVFFLTFSHNTLVAPTTLVFIAGLIKYGERIRALHAAAIDNFRKSLVPKPDPGPNYAKLMEEYCSRKQAGLPVEIIKIPELDPSRAKKTKLASSSSIDAAEKNHGGPNEAKERINYLKEVQKAYFFFQKFQGLIVDMIYSSDDRWESLQYFISKKPEEAFKIIEIELAFMYEVFYTKASIVRHWFWFACKSVSNISVVVALVLFVSAEKNGFDKLDVKVTYALLYGALALDVMAILKHIFTDYTATFSVESPLDSPRASWFQKFKIRFFRCFNENILARFLLWRMPSWTTLEGGRYDGCHKLSTRFLFCRWSGSVSGHNLLKYCLDESVPRVPNLNQRVIAKSIQLCCFHIVLFVQYVFFEVLTIFCGEDLVDQWKYKSKIPFLRELWEHIFEELQKNSEDAHDDLGTIESICSARGEWVLKKTKFKSEHEKIGEKLKPFVEQNKVAFDESLLLWHIATNLCNARDDGGDDEPKREISMLISDYMLYLLIMQPNMMSAVAGNGQQRFRDTCEEAKNFFMKRNLAQWDREKMQKEACNLLIGVPTEEKPIDVKGDRSKSLLFEACMLAKELEELENHQKWELTASVWVELLSYAASHCRPTGHVQLLSKGGELISFVWLLMAHLGLGKQFQIMEGHARVKLIVDK